MQTYCRHDAALILDEIGRLKLDNCMNVIATKYKLSDRFLMEMGHLLDIYTLSGMMPMDTIVYNKYIDRLDWEGVTKHIKLDVRGIDFIITNIDKISTSILCRLGELDDLDCTTLSVIINHYLGKNAMTEEDWKTVSKYKFLDSEFLRSYEKYLDWCEVSKNNRNIPIDLILKNVDDLHWRDIWFFYKFKENELVAIINKLLERGFFIDGGAISSTQTLSEPFMDAYADILNWTNISEYQKMSYDFLNNHLDKINLFHLDKNCVTDRDIIDRFIYNRNTADAYDARWIEF